MSYTTPPTFSGGAGLAAADLDILGDDIAYLKDITDGVSFSAVRLTRSAATSIADSTWTSITPTVEVFDFGGWWSSGVNSVVPAGSIPSAFSTIAIIAIINASFAANGTGYRGVRLLLNGSSEIAQTQPGFASDTAVIIGAGMTIVSAGDTLTLQVYQNSGGALNASSMQILIARFAPAT